MNRNINYIGMVNLLRHLQNADLVSRKDLRPAPGGDRGGRHIFPLIFVMFGYGYFAAVLVLCVAEKEVIPWASRRKPAVPWR